MMDEVTIEIEGTFDIIFSGRWKASRNRDDEQEQYIQTGRW